MEHQVNPARTGGLQQKHAKAIQTMVGQFLAKLPGSKITGEEDVRVVMGDEQPGTSTTHLKNGEVTLSIDLPEDTGIMTKHAYYHAMVGAFIAKHPSRKEMVPREDGFHENSLHLVFEDKAYISEFFNACSRIPLLSNAEIIR